MKPCSAAITQDENRGDFDQYKKPSNVIKKSDSEYPATKKKAVG